MASEPRWNALADAVASLEPIQDAATFIANIVDAISTAITIQKSVLDILATLAVDSLDVPALAVKTALSVLEETIAQYLKFDANVHTLIVPLRRQLPETFYSEFSMPYPSDEWTIGSTLGDKSKRIFHKTLEEVARADHGNLGFARSVIEAAQDEGDPNAPRFGPDAATFGVVILGGAQSIVALYELMRLLEGLFGTALKNNPLLPREITPAPEDLHANPIGVSDAPRIGVRLKWKNAPTLQSLANFQGVRVRISELAIIRSIDEEILKAQNWMDIFGNLQPAPLPKDSAYKKNTLISQNKMSSVILQQRFDGVTHVYIDDDPTLDKWQPYYYALAYRYEMADEPKNPKEKLTYTLTNFFTISNVVQVLIEDELPSTRDSISPDWLAFPSPLDLFPKLKFLLALLQAGIGAAGSMTLGASTFLKSYIAFLDAELTRYLNFVEEINALVAKLASLLQIPAVGLYITTIETPTGGIDAFLQEMVRRLTDRADPSTPPFIDSGVTTGVVVVMGAPNPAQFKSTQQLLELLLGLSKGFAPWQEAMDSLERLVGFIEDKYFKGDMTEGSEPVSPPSHTTFNDAMAPVEASDASANIPYDP